MNITRGGGSTWMLKISSPVDSAKTLFPTLENHMKNERQQGFSQLWKWVPSTQFIIKQKRLFYLSVMISKVGISLHHILFSDKVQAAAFSTTKSILGENEYFLSLMHFTLRFPTRRKRLCREAQGKNTSSWLRNRLC